MNPSANQKSPQCSPGPSAAGAEPRLQLGSDTPVLAIIGIIASIAVGAAVVWWARSGGFWHGPRPIRADFNDVLPDDVSIGPGSAGALRVAVAAMISPQATSARYEDLLESVGKKIGMDVTFIRGRTHDQITRMLGRREVDLVLSCPGQYVTAHDRFGAEVLAVPVVGRAKVSRSYILVHKDSPIRTLADLKGKTFAFTVSDSHTGRMALAYMLAKRGLSPSTFFDATFFTHGHDSSVRAVAKGLVVGAAVDSLVWEFMNATDPEYTSRTRIIARSAPYGIPPVIVHPSLERELKQRLRQAFLNLHEDPAGEASLRALRIDRFQRGGDGDYESVRKMQKRLAAKGETR